MSKFPYFIYNASPKYREHVTSVRAFYDAMYIATVKYNIKHGKKNLTKRYMVKAVLPFIPKWFKQSWYKLYSIEEQLYWSNLILNKYKQK